MKAQRTRCYHCNTEMWNYDLINGMCVECFIKKLKKIEEWVKLNKKA